MALYKSKFRTTRIKILHMPLGTERDVVMAMKKSNKSLVEAIVAHKEKLEEEGGECFEHLKNIIACDSGWYIAKWESGMEFEVFDPTPNVRAGVSL